GVAAWAGVVDLAIDVEVDLACGDVDDLLPRMAMDRMRLLAGRKRGDVHLDLVHGDGGVVEDLAWAGGGQRVEVDEGGVQNGGILRRPVGGNQWRRGRGLRMRGKSEGERCEEQRKGGGRENARKTCGFHARED